MATYPVLAMCVSSSLSLPASLHYPDEDLFREDISLQFTQLDQSFDGPEVFRQERDGGSHGSDHRRRSGRRDGRNRQQVQQIQGEQVFQEDRGGRQSGPTGLALGVLNSPPTEDGSYNFK